jgi:RNA polymerase sigma-70 factor (ECF subfamily)
MHWKGNPMPKAKPDTPSKQVRFTEKEREFVYGVAMKYLKDEEEARDVTQEAMLLAFRHRESFRGDSRFTTWLYRIAATTALMHLRKRRRSPKMLSCSGDDDQLQCEPRSEEPSPEELSCSSQAVEQCERSLEHMGEKYGNIFRMRFLEGYSESEIAHRLGLNVSTVKTRAYRARTYLKRQLAGLGRAAA